MHRYTKSGVLNIVYRDNDPVYADEECSRLSRLVENERGLAADLQSVLREVLSVLDSQLGDTDPLFDEDATDEEVRDIDPLFWAHRRIAAVFSSGEAAK